MVIISEVAAQAYSWSKITPTQKKKEKKKVLR